MTDYTLDQLTELVNSILARLSALDGENLPPGNYGALRGLTRQVNGLSTTLSQYSLLIQSQLNDLQQEISFVQNPVTTWIKSKPWDGHSRFRFY